MSVETLPNFAPHESAAPIEPRTRQEAAVDTERDSLVVFLIDAHAVAEATDPMLASLLSGMLGWRPSKARPAWAGERRDGLELCQRLLTYVRQERVDRRLDVSLGYIAVELRSLHGSSASAVAH